MTPLMAIDPGLQGTGYAIWTQPRLPVAVGVIHGGTGEWLARVDTIAAEVLERCVQYRVRRIICEMMEMQQSARAKMAWSGDLQRTLILIGTIHGSTVLRIPRSRFLLTPPSEWKGNLPKSVTIRRVQRCLGPRVCERLAIHTHAWDAVGIGLWHQGLIT